MQNNKGDKWLNDLWEKISAKTKKNAEKYGDKTFIYTTKDGEFVEAESPYFWVNGFWCGINWLMYLAENDESYKGVAQGLVKALDAPLHGFIGLHHDVGFMYHLSAVADYRITGSKESYYRGLNAATLLLGRFNTVGNFIRAWNDDPGCEGERPGWAIIDSMMNIPLLYWASKVTKDPRFKQVAIKHADTVLENFVRADGSIIHIGSFNPETGEFIESLKGQGYSPESSWTRGQAWALYGFILSYIHTGYERYLNVAKKIAKVFVSNLTANAIPPSDFKSPEDEKDKARDSSAGAIAACGLLELYKHVNEDEKEFYYDWAVRIIKALSENCTDWSGNEDAILTNGCVTYNTRQCTLIYGDFFFIEAVRKLLGEEFLIW